MAVLSTGADVIDLAFRRLVVPVRAIAPGVHPWTAGSVRSPDAEGRRELAAAMRVVSR